jgi:hypothetical protein
MLDYLAAHWQQAVPIALAALYVLFMAWKRGWLSGLKLPGFGKATTAQDDMLLVLGILARAKTRAKEGKVGANLSAQHLGEALDSIVQELKS